MQKDLQREAMDEDLRNRLWNALNMWIYDRWEPREAFRPQSSASSEVENLAMNYWHELFKNPIDTMPEFKSNHRHSAYLIIRKHFFGLAWWEVFDFIEFTAKNIPDVWFLLLRDECNRIFEQENAAYRFAGDEIVEITDEHEIEAIESAIDRGVTTVSSHLSRSLELLSDKKNPDYRNSIKESISAVEALCRIISGDDKATLGAALKKVDEVHPMHNAFKEALNKLYGYTSDQSGIRHSMLEDATNPTYADAKFLLVSCAAFTNFLWTKAAENHLSLNHQAD